MNKYVFFDLLKIKIPGLEYAIDDNDTSWVKPMTDEEKKTTRLFFENETSLCHICKNRRGSKECRASNCSKKRKEMYKEFNK